jgi:hypothetical protein
VAWQPLIGLEYLQQVAGLQVPLVWVPVGASGQMQREGQIDNGVNLARRALVHIESQLEMSFQRGSCLVAAVKLSEAHAKPLIGDREVALVVGAVGFGLGKALADGE